MISVAVFVSTSLLFHRRDTAKGSCHADGGDSVVLALTTTWVSGCLLNVTRPWRRGRWRAEAVTVCCYFENVCRTVCEVVIVVMW